MKNLRIKLFCKPKRGVSFLSTGSITEDLKKLDDARSESKTPTFILGTPGTGFKQRVFEESVFRLDLVPKYVSVIKQFVHPETGKIYFSYVDTYGKKIPKVFDGCYCGSFRQIFVTRR